MSGTYQSFSRARARGSYSASVLREGSPESRYRKSRSSVDVTQQSGTKARRKEEKKGGKMSTSDREEVIVASNVTVHNQLYVTTRESPCKSIGGRKPEPQVHCIGDFISDPPSPSPRPSPFSTPVRRPIRYGLSNSYVYTTPCFDLNKLFNCPNPQDVFI